MTFDLAPRTLGLFLIHVLSLLVDALLEFIYVTSSHLERVFFGWELTGEASCNTL